LFNVPDTNVVVKNIMINEGTEPLPYQEWNGSIIHEKDIKPVLLWENASPNASLASQPISISSLLNYIKIGQRFKIGYKRSIVNGAGIQYQEFEIMQISENTNVYLFGENCYRPVFLTTTGKLEIWACTNYESWVENNELLIPCKLYALK
jgi:hypothetical protein